MFSQKFSNVKMTEVSTSFYRQNEKAKGRFRIQIWAGESPGRLQGDTCNGPSPVTVRHLSQATRDQSRATCEGQMIRGFLSTNHRLTSGPTRFRHVSFTKANRSLPRVSHRYVLHGPLKTRHVSTHAKWDNRPSRPISV